MKTFKQFLTESKQVGDIYHYTSIYGAKSILDDNTIYASALNDFPSVSTTRDKNLHKSSRIVVSDGKKYNIRAGVNTDISFVLDGNKLSQRKKIKPFSYIKGLTKIQIPKSAEYEEQVYGDISNVKDFIKKIRIHSDLDNKEIELLKNHNIPIEFNK